LRQVPRLTAEGARRQLYGLASGLVGYGSLPGRCGRGLVGGPHGRGRLPLLVPEIDASATLDRLERLMRESTLLHEELDALGIVLLARPPPGQLAAVGRLIPLDELVRAFAAGQQRGEE
jgi:hypothetical protein